MTVNRVSSAQAIALAEEGVAYLDVRSVPEFEGGHPQGAFNVPLMHMGPGGMQPNQTFEAEVAAAFARDTPLLVGCKSGGRSARAAAMLERLGFANLYDVAGGYGGAPDDPGWLASGGPVSTTTEPGRSYDDLKK